MRVQVERVVVGKEITRSRPSLRDGARRGTVFSERGASAAGNGLKSGPSDRVGGKIVSNAIKYC